MEITQLNNIQGIPNPSLNFQKYKEASKHQPSGRSEAIATRRKYTCFLIIDFFQSSMDQPSQNKKCEYLVRPTDASVQLHLMLDA